MLERGGLFLSLKGGEGYRLSSERRRGFFKERGTQVAGCEVAGWAGSAKEKCGNNQPLNVRISNKILNNILLSIYLLN